MAPPFGPYQLAVGRRRQRRRDARDHVRHPHQPRDIVIAEDLGRQ
ncbi:MAG: hypothetical protein ACKVOI_10840 [Dongiaceae bacterium]